MAAQTASQAAGPGPARKDVDYKGAPLDAARGPGLGCFWLQILLLVVVMFLTPLSAAWEWPVPITVVLLAATLVLLLFVGQTVIFLLRLVAADRRAAGAAGRRRPVRSATRTVGEIEDEAARSDEGHPGTPGEGAPSTTHKGDEPGG
jgi:hypothetical protein